MALKLVFDLNHAKRGADASVQSQSCTDLAPCFPELPPFRRNAPKTVFSRCDPGEASPPHAPR